MGLQRLVRAGTPAEVSVLGAVASLLGLGCFAVAAFPLSEETPRELVAAVGLACLTIAVVLVRAGAAVRPAGLHVAVVLLTTIVGLKVAIAATERGLMLSALSYTWMAVYVTYFFGAAAARRHAGLMIAALGVSMLAARAPTDVSVWLTISAMVGVAVSILTRLNARLRAQAHTDGLTGLLNRTGFSVAAARERATAARHGEPVVLVVIDLDEFKLVNDARGHAAGDRLLTELAGVWTGSLRPGDLLARFGGDEFVLLLSGAAEDQADSLLARLALAHPAPWTAGAVLCTGDETLDEAIDRADRRLYVAKEPGRRAIEQARKARIVPSLRPAR